MTTPRSTRRETLREFHDEKAVEQAVDHKLMWRVLPYLAPHQHFVWVSLALMAVQAWFSAVRPKQMGQVVTTATSSNSDHLWRESLILTLVIVGSQVVSFAQNYAMQVAGARSMADLREVVFRYLQRLELRFLDKTPLGRLTTRATSDIDAMGELFASGVLNAIGDVLSLVTMIVTMLLLDAKLAMCTFASLPLVWLLVQAVRKRSRLSFRAIRAKTARMNAFLSEQVAGVGVVQAYAREDAMQREFDEHNKGYFDANRSSILYESILDAALEMVAIICIASVLYFGAYSLQSDHRVSFAVVVTFTQFVRQFFEPVSLLAQRYTLLQSALAGAERVFQLLDNKAAENWDDVPKKGKITDASSGSAVEPPLLAFRDVTFAYKEGAPVLRNLDFAIKRGERIAIVGKTGSGKSTIVSLLLRLYEISGGRIELAGEDTRQIALPKLRSRFAWVTQDVFLFRGTLLSNIAGGDPIDEARATQVLGQVGGERLLRERGLDGLVEERGSNFSAGEKQLIAFARALYRKADVLILDEATASVDSDTETTLQHATEAVMRERTCIVIAHRLSTIEQADRIMVVHDGTIAEAGTHAELLAQGGRYAELRNAVLQAKH
jgi:ATP-binding cassette, subfamily B, multidrug efflux pump